MYPSVDQLLRAQHGAIAAAQCRRLGISHQTVRTLLRRREWLRLHRGIYLATWAWPEAELDRLAVRCHALLLVMPPGTLVSHRTAAALWRLVSAEVGDASEIDLTVPLGTAVPAVRGVRVHRSTESIPVQRPAGVAATGMARTVIDVAREETFRDAVVIADSALASEPRLDLRGELLASYAWPGYRKAAAVVAFADGRAESVLETHARVLWHQHGLPPPLLQAPIFVGRHFVARVDFCWPAARLIVEVDGMAKYDLPGEIAREKQRQNALVRAGYTVLRFTWTDIVHNPDAAVTLVRECLAGARAN